MNQHASVCLSIKSINNLCLRLFKPIDNNITHMQGAIISIIYDHSDTDIFQRDIEKIFNIRRSTATRILNHMERNGLINRFPSDRDKRMKKLVLTSKAAAFHNKILDNIMEIEDIIKKGLSREELDMFFSITAKMIKNLQ